METVQRFHSPRFLYYRKLRHSVVSRQERMRSILWNWPLGQFFFMRRPAYGSSLPRQRAGCVASRAKIFPARLYLGKGKKAMRLDKYLKVSRLIKRRTVANEACDAGRVLINDRPAKASANVKQGDIITIQFGNKEVKVEVLDVQETVKKEEAKELFRYI